MKFSCEAHLARELARHDADIDAAERERLARIERLPETLPTDIEEADLGLLFEIIGGDDMLGQKFRELLWAAMSADRTEETVCNTARAFAAELLDVCADLCVELDRNSLPWDHAQVIAEMPVISERRLADRLRAASFKRGAE